MASTVSGTVIPIIKKHKTAAAALKMLEAQNEVLEPVFTDDSKPISSILTLPFISQKNPGPTFLEFKAGQEEEIRASAEGMVDQLKYDIDLDQFKMVQDVKRNYDGAKFKEEKEHLFKEKLGSREAAKEFILVDDIIDRVRYRVRNYISSKENYSILVSFIVVIFIYFSILLMQCNPTVSYSIESTLTNFIFTRDSGTAEFDGSISDSVDGADDIITWLTTVIAGQVWKDPVCGNGKCEPPQASHIQTR